MTYTRPNVTYPFSMMSRYQGNQEMSHWTTIKNILKYLRNKKNISLVYGGEPELEVKGYSDASCETYRHDSKS